MACRGSLGLELLDAGGRLPGQRRRLIVCETFGRHVIHPQPDAAVKGQIAAGRVKGQRVKQNLVFGLIAPDIALAGFSHRRRVKAVLFVKRLVDGKDFGRPGRLALLGRGLPRHRVDHKPARGAGPRFPAR